MEAWGWYMAWLGAWGAKSLFFPCMTSFASTRQHSSL
jgi:hypothetical protein